MTSIWSFYIANDVIIVILGLKYLRIEVLKIILSSLVTKLSSVRLSDKFSGGHFESSNMAARGHISLVCRQILKCLGHVSL